jgi:hypothetical protein
MSVNVWPIAVLPRTSAQYFRCDACGHVWHLDASSPTQPAADGESLRDDGNKLLS